MMNDHMTDVTNEHDVSDDVMLHDESAIPSINEDDVDMSNSMRFVSMDTNTYLMDKSIINWEETLKNKQNIEENLFFVRKVLNELIFQHNESHNSGIDEAFGPVLDFIKEFGFDPTKSYSKMYPDANDFDFALMYCIDAIEIMNVLLHEIASYEGAKNAIGSIMETMNNIGGMNDERRVEESDEQ